jgi:hypothetical protein
MTVLPATPLDVGVGMRDLPTTPLAFWLGTLLAPFWSFPGFLVVGVGFATFTETTLLLLPVRLKLRTAETIEDDDGSCGPLRNSDDFRGSNPGPRPSRMAEVMELRRLA